MPTYENGKIPPSLLRRVSNFVPVVSGVTSAIGSDLLREDAWAALNMLQLAFLDQFERALNVSEAYRGLTRQTAVWQQYLGGGNLAARPGTSNHGWGVALDFGSGVSTYGSAAKYWMDRNAYRWGWWPVGNDFPKREAWHFEFKPGTATEVIPASGSATPFPVEDDTMSAAEISDLKKYMDQRTDDLGALLRTLTSGRTDDLATLIRDRTAPLLEAEGSPRPEAQHRLVRLKGQVHVFHSVDFHTMRWVKTEKDLADLGWQLQQIGALTPASVASQVLEVGTLAPFGTILGARPVDSAGKALAAYVNL